MINTRVHDHDPEGPRCFERFIENDPETGRVVLRGSCLEYDGCSRGAHDPSGSVVKRSAGCLERPVRDELNERTRCAHVAWAEQTPDRRTPPCPDSSGQADGGSPHRCRTATAIPHTIHVCSCGWGWADPAEEILPVLESTPRRVHLVGVLTDLMALLDAELDDLAELRRDVDGYVQEDVEHTMDKLNTVWAKIAEARTAVRSCDLGHLPLPEVG